MTHVILTKDGLEKKIEFPTPNTFAGFIVAIRAQVPDRGWQIHESWTNEPGNEGEEF